MSKKYEVYVDDNYHYMDESERHAVGSFKSLGKALAKCVELTVGSLEEFYEDGITPDKLRAQWTMFGEDPFIVGPVASVPFSAREFITTGLCEAIIASRNTDE